VARAELSGAFMRMRSITRAYSWMSLVFRRGGEAPGMLGTCADAVWGVGVVVGIVKLVELIYINYKYIKKIIVNIKELSLLKLIKYKIYKSYLKAKLYKSRS